MDSNDLTLLRQMMKEVVGEELKPINKHIEKVDKRLDKMQNDINEMKEDISIIKEDLEEVRGTTDTLSEWAEAVTVYKFPDLHYPLHDNEKLT